MDVVGRVLVGVPRREPLCTKKNNNDEDGSNTYELFAWYEPLQLMLMIELMEDGILMDCWMDGNRDVTCGEEKEGRERGTRVGGVV